MEQEPLGTPDDTVLISDINCWGTLPSASQSIHSSLKLDDREATIRNTIVTESLIIHELDNRFLEEVCREEDDNTVTREEEDSTVVASVEHSHVTLSEKGSEPECVEHDYGGKVDQAEEIKVAKHFAVNEDINQKVSFWCGNISRVEADGCAAACVEMLREKQPSQTRQLLRNGGVELQKQVFNAYRCTTGDTVLFKSSILPTRNVILSPGPKYNPKYRSASQNTLFCCYRNIFNLALDNKIEALTIGKIYTKTKMYPEKDAVHLALRVTRKFLEKHGSSFTRICFVLETSKELSCYQELFPYYFPRNSADYKFQLELPDSMGGDYGEPIRRGAAPNYIRAHWSESSTPLAKKLEVTRTDFGKMRQDPDTARLQRAAQQPDVYNQLLQWSKTEDFSRIAKCRAVYQSGFDVDGAPVVVCVGRHFPDHIPQHQMLSYCVQVLDPITTRPYCLVYFHTGCSGNRPDIRIMETVFASSPLRYRTNLKALYSIHATTLQKLMTWWFTVSKVKEVKGKIVQLRSLEDLFEKIPPQQIQIPQFVLDYSFETSGSTSTTAGL